MDNLTLGTIVLTALFIVGSGVHYLVQRFVRPGQGFFYRTATGSLVVERDNRIVDSDNAVVIVSYSSEDPLALCISYYTSRQYFEPQNPAFSVSVARDQVAHALATGTSRNLNDTADILAIFCSELRLKGRGNTTFTWTAPRDPDDVHILTVPTKVVLRVINASYDIVAPGEELSEPFNNLDSVLDEILAGSTSPTVDED